MSAPALLRNVSQRHDLWRQFAARAIEMRHRGSYLGVLWTVLNPLLMLAMYVTVFGFIFQSRFNAFPDESAYDYALAVFLGLILFHVTAETIAASPSYIVTNPNLVKKVVFPLEILPLANVTALWFHFGVSFALLVLASLVSDHPPSVTSCLWLPVILAPHILFSFGVGWALSALCVFFRDVAQVVGFATQILLYASAVFYPVSKISEQSALLWSVLKWNPLLHTVDLARQSLLWHQPIDLSRLAYTWATGIVTLLLGAWFFKKLQPAFADVI